MELFIGSDDELQYLVSRYDDGTTTVATRPKTDEHIQPSVRWSPPVTLKAEGDQ